MPVTATPVSGEISCDTQMSGSPAPALVPVGCEGQRVFLPTTPIEPTKNVPVLGRTHSVTIQGGQDGTIKWIMRDPTGVPIDLSACACASGSSGSSSEDSSDCQYALICRLGEVLDCEYTELSAEISDAANGEVEITVTHEDVRTPGIYFMEVAIVDPDDNAKLYFSNRFYLTINRNFWSSNTEGPPSIAEVRLHLRDSSPAESFLLDNFRFSDEEIAACMVRPVQFWNETPPRLCQQYDTTNFPFRHHWLEATTAYLFMMAAEKYRANQLAYTAGVRIDDQNKEPNYEAAAERRLRSWLVFVHNKKDELNRAEFSGSSLSAYSYWGY